MWIVPPSIRSAFSRESGCLTKDCTPDLDLWASEAERSCTLNGKPTRSQSWKQGCKKAPYLMRLSGLAICANLTQSSFQAWWIASLRASRAKTCHSPADALASMASAAGCSLKSPALPVIAVRDTCFWRTSQASLLPPPPLWTKPKALLTNAQPPASWENWPTSGGMRSGSLFQRPTLEPATGGRGGFAGHGGRWDTPDGMPEAPNTGSNRKAQVAGLGNQAQQVTTWATPQARDHKNPDKPESGNYQRKLEQGYTIDLNSQAAKWASPKASDGQHGGPNMRGSKGELPLPSQAAKWATPDCNTSTYSNGKMGPNIREQAATWPTPVANDDNKTPEAHMAMKARMPGGARNTITSLKVAVQVFSPQAQPTQPGQASSSTGPTSPRRLNPAFTEWLMGWPTGWTIAVPSASSAAGTALWRHRLALHLSALCAE